MSKIISFPQGGKPYALDRRIFSSNGVISLIALTGPELVTLHNLIASNLGASSVKRFADAKTAVRRTWGMLEKYEAECRLEALDNAIAAHPSPTPKHVQASIAEREQRLPGETRQEMDARTGQLAKDTAEIKAGAGKTPRWARPKHEAASRVAYKPKDGTIQHVMYLLLTRAGGTPMEEFCTIVEASGTKDKTLYTPPMVWSALRYLFVDRRGYGLDFDGARLSLLVPKDERDGAGKGA